MWSARKRVASLLARWQARRRRGNAALRDVVRHHMTVDIDDLFELLGRWRHLPSYQLERRADVFFALFMREMLAERFGVALEEELVPEFPVKRALIWPSHQANRSVKVDYVAFARDRSRCLFVELKTDVESRRDAQDEYLERIGELGLATVLDGLIDIVQATNAHRKYFHLLSILEQLGVLELPDGLADQTFPRAERGRSAMLDDIAVCVEPGEFDVDVVYVQPRGDGEGVIDFAEFADWLNGRGALAEAFSEALLDWRTPAGAAAPG
jgi:hypothetical protein